MAIRNQKGIAHLGILLTILVLIVAGAGYWVYHKHNTKTDNSQTTSQPATTTTTDITKFSGTVSAYDLTAMASDGEGKVTVKTAVGDKQVTITGFGDCDANATLPPKNIGVGVKVSVAAIQNGDKYNVCKAGTFLKVTDPYVGWKTYTSSYEKASFKYPSNWQLKNLGSLQSQYAPKSDNAKLTSPSGSFYVSWSTAISGLGGACDDTHKPPYTDANGLGACPYFIVMDKEKLTAADLYYVAGIKTYDGTKYSPWFALASKDIGITKTGSYLGIEVFKSKVNDYYDGFNGGSAISGNTGFALTTKAKAEAFFDSDEANQAKLILTSYSY